MTLARQTVLLGSMLAAAVAPGAAGKQATSVPGNLPRTQHSGPSPARVPGTTTQGTTSQPRVSSPERARNPIATLPALPFNNTTVVLDPAHGGSDNGSRISDNIVEKDVTLALAFQLRSLLSARGFNVVLTRDSDKANTPTPPFAPLTLDDRAGLANHQRAAACLLLHATGSGTGVHLYSSELEPAPGETTPQPWLTGQAAWIPQSQHLTSQVADALTRARLPLVSGSASVRPLDSLTCPALVLELAPATEDVASINDQQYQRRVAEAVAGALVLWKDAVQPPPYIAPPTKSAAPEGLE